MYLLCAIAPNWIPLKIKEPKWSKQTSSQTQFKKKKKNFFYSRQPEQIEGVGSGDWLIFTRAG